MKIAVVGASGRLGQYTVKSLLERKDVELTLLSRVDTAHKLKDYGRAAN